MIRWIAFSALLGALVAAGGLYATGDSRSSIGLWFGTDSKYPPENWPICSAMATMGSEADWAQLDPDFATGKKAMVEEDWNRAIAALKLAALRDPHNADIQNYIGYAYRRLRQWGSAMQYYQQALELNRRHRSAHEHLGELYLALGEPARAEQQLATLEEICLIPCAETGDLKRALAAYKMPATR